MATIEEFPLEMTLSTETLIEIHSAYKDIDILKYINVEAMTKEQLSELLTYSLKEIKELRKELIEAKKRVNELIEEIDNKN